MSFCKAEDCCALLEGDGNGVIEEQDHADLLKGRTITSYPPLKDEVVNAGDEFKDEEVAVDGNYVTSRTPKDEPAFVRELLNVR